MPFSEPYRGVREEGFLTMTRRLPETLSRETIACAMMNVSAVFDNNADFHLPFDPARFSAAVHEHLLYSLEAYNSRTPIPLVRNGYHNGYPDLIPQGRYESDAIKAAEDGVEIKVKATSGPAFDAHSNRTGWHLVFCITRSYVKSFLIWKSVYCAFLEPRHYRVNNRGARGSRTASPNESGVVHLAAGRVYFDDCIYDTGNSPRKITTITPRSLRFPPYQDSLFGEV